MGVAFRNIRIKIITKDVDENFDDEVASKLAEIRKKIGEIENVEVIGS